MRKNRDKRFSVNFSYIDFTNEATMSCLFEELLKCKAPQNLTLEILESENIQDYGIIKEKILQIKKFGCQISIDDFGAGHSNYYRLSQLDVDYIKIDGNIIKNLDKDTFSMQVIQSIVDFAKKSEYPVVAEYVHSEKILDIIRECGIEYAQGYYFAQPKLPSEIL
jgi:EAL domain-containing protein (putative c-di-GMP-specific phosphodiesterase class I)